MSRTGYSQRLELRQTQTLVMTPQLQQAIKMLQLSNLELAQFIDAEIQQNPLLERREARLEQTAPASAAGAPESPTPPLPEAMADNFTPEAAEHWHAASGLEGDGSADFGGEPYSWHRRNGAVDGAGRFEIEQTATRPRTLREHLLEQIGTDLSDPADRVIALSDGRIASVQSNTHKVAASELIW